MTKIELTMKEIASRGGKKTQMRNKENIKLVEKYRRIEIVANDKTITNAQAVEKMLEILNEK